MDETYDELSNEWKLQFFKLKPVIPAVIQLVTAVVILIVGCFGEVHVGTPWWAGILFVLSGTSLCLLFTWQLVKLEICAIVTVVLSILASVAAITTYVVEFSFPQLFPHDGSDQDQLVRTYQVDNAILGLCAFELGLSVWILTILIILRKTFF